MNFLYVWRMISALGPVIYLMADAFRYGATKFGDGTWRTTSSAEHIDAALRNIVAWKNGDTTQPQLVDATLRMAFALAQAISGGTTPKEYVK